MRVVVFCAHACLLAVSFLCTSGGPLSRHNQLLVLENERAVKDAQYEEEKRSQTCITLRKSVFGRQESRGTWPYVGERNSRPKRDASQPHALYFDGKQALRLKANRHGKEVLIPNEKFTVELWLNPEGGQQHDSFIVGLVDDCIPLEGLGWSLGITQATSGGNRDARIYFRLRTDRARSESIMWSPHAYNPGVWLHLAITYDGKRTKLYLNGAKMTLSLGQRGHVFASVLKRCKHIQLGGDVRLDKFYRGTLGALRLWDVARRHREIANTMFENSVQNSEHLVIEDNFLDLRLWANQGTKFPHHVMVSADPNTHDLGFSAPPCGQSLCDDPAAVDAYLTHPNLRNLKMLRYNIINLCDDDGNNPTVSVQQIEAQDAEVRRVFKSYNISWQMEQLTIRNTSLRTKTILFGCKPEKVGNSFCNWECYHAMTGYDGGDCHSTLLDCPLEKLGDGVCDSVCNLGVYNWDDGDCCQGGSADCFDPASPHRVYVSVEEYKSWLNLANDRSLNVYFANWTDESLLGVATLPWERTVFSVHGGIVVRPDAFGKSGRMNNLIHELGHVLGLWHVHYGVSEMSCGDACLETNASMYLGDMCSDTKPTPENSQCRDPPAQLYFCSVPHQLGTPYNNYMSYSGDNCSDHFTKQQVARMHCYSDMVYQAWQDVRIPSALPLSPQVVRAYGPEVSLAWVPPVGTAAASVRHICTSCLPDYSLVQYAATAWSPSPSGTADYSATIQATGPPDSPQCGASTWAWIPEELDCEQDRCFIDLGLEHPVIPRRISLWFIWEADQVSRLELMYSNGKVESITQVHAYCDMPWTMDLAASNFLVKVRVYVSSPFVGVDALRVWSKANVAPCKVCRPLRYELTREPPFTIPDDKLSTSIRGLTNTYYIDRDVKVGTTYRYTVQAATGGKVGLPSPTLVYTHGQPFCGDGVTNRTMNEACDDGNRRDGDGCSLHCQTEQGFVCTGEPSLCYLPEGDGVCEEFERQYSTEDCGFFTPDGYMDQWAVTTEADPRFQLSVCPTQVVTGAPALPLGCYSEVDSTKGWAPCGYLYHNTLPWLKAYFDQPVVVSSVLVYFHSDGRSKYDRSTKKIDVALLQHSSEDTVILSSGLEVKCQENPMIVNVLQDLSKQHYLSQGVLLTLHSSGIAISAVSVRSALMNVLQVGRCASAGLLYNPRTGFCTDYQCERSTCQEPVIKHATIVCQGHREGDTCSVTCQKGYEAARQKKMTCVEGMWLGNVTCTKVDCGQPEMTYAKFDCPGGTTLHSRCKFECRLPARKLGYGNSIRCESDGLWSAPEGYCQVMCAGPPVVKNATLLTKSCAVDHQTVGTECKLKCEQGFHVEGERMNKRVMKSKCTEAGGWEAASCQKVRCGHIPLINTGFYSCTDSFTVNSSCTLKCPGPNGAVSRVNCQANGEWNQDLTPCKFPPGDCPRPEARQNLRFGCPSQSIGAVCEVHCPPNQTPVRRNGAIDNGESAQRADTILCTGARSWHPPIKELACIDKCKEEFIGDGFCDGVNNQSMCQFDGGDCCPSTVQGGVVQPFPSTCVDECACVDPNALENRHINRA